MSPMRPLGFCGRRTGGLPEGVTYAVAKIPRHSRGTGAGSTYPFAANLPGETPFHAAKGTPIVNGLYSSAENGQLAGPLLTSNPNGGNPVRLGPGDPMTCDQDHGYTDEQKAADHGAEDSYPASAGHSLSVTQ